MAKTSKYHKLFEPLQIGNIKLKNRIVKPSQWFIYAEPDGSIGERVIGWYESLAKGGCGLITIEESICEYPLGASQVPHIRLDDDKFIPGLTKLAKAIHKHDCHVVVQITHAGPAHQPVVSGGMQPVAPSSIDPPAEPGLAIARELTVPEIKELVEKFAQAALRVKKAGFDGVEMHMAHYALVNAFLSRIQNKRTDEYGYRSLENRARFSREILRRVRELVGPDFVVGIRLTCKEWGHPLGTTPEEASEFAKMFEKEGINYIQASAYGYGEFMLCVLPNMVAYPEITPSTKQFVKRIPTGALIPEDEIIRKAVSIPVSGAGSLTFEAAERLLEEHKVDMVCFGRRMMADPEFPNKLREGREEEIRPCAGCMYCLHTMMMPSPVQCRVNAFAGNETELIIKPVKKAKKVMVIGAGPAGLEVARVAAERGHQVSLYDSASYLGGLLPMASFIKEEVTDDIPPLIKYYETQLKRLGVTISLNTSVDVNLVDKAKPDVVVLAVGGETLDPNIPVEKGANVKTTEELKKEASKILKLVGSKRMSQLTKIFMPVGRKVVVVGSDIAGLQTAEFLVKRGKEVTVVDEAKEIGEGMLAHWMIKLPPWLAQKNVRVFNGVKYKKVTPKGITFISKEGEEMTIPADTVMVVNKYKTNNTLAKALKGKVPEIHIVGDAKSDKRAYIHGCIHEGARLGLTI